MKNKKIEQIEKMLSKAIKMLNEDDYLNLIESNDNLSNFDSIMIKLDEVKDSEIYLKELNGEMLDDIITYLKEKIG